MESFIIVIVLFGYVWKEFIEVGIYDLVGIYNELFNI